MARVVTIFGLKPRQRQEIVTAGFLGLIASCVLQVMQKDPDKWFY